MVAYGAGLQLQDATPAGGVPLIDGTQVVASWTAPDDGQPHAFELNAAIFVTDAETGGLVSLTYTLMGGQVGTPSVFAAGLAAGGDNSSVTGMRLVAPGSTVTLEQASALTAGASTVWAQLWGA